MYLCIRILAWRPGLSGQEGVGNGEREVLCVFYCYLYGIVAAEQLMPRLIGSGSL